MKKIVYFLLIFAIMFIIPFNVFAEGEENSEGEAEAEKAETSNKVKLYFFRGDGCPHCQEAEEWFSKLDDEFKAKFDIVDYETWNNKDNADLMNKVAAFRKEEDKATGVPYIIVGDKSWVGFSESDYGEEIKAEINKLYETDVKERYDVMNLLNKPEEKDSSNDVLSLVVLLIIVAGVCFGIYKARESVN